MRILVCFLLYSSLRLIVVVKKTLRYSNVFFYNRTRAYAAIPQLRNFEHYYEKRYNTRQNERLMERQR